MLEQSVTGLAKTVWGALLPTNSEAKQMLSSYILSDLSDIQLIGSFNLSKNERIAAA